MKKVRMIVQGRVQGVGFRWSVWELANSLGGITGRVWNREDGLVEILAQAEDTAKMALFIQEVRKGPSPFSKVTYVDVTLANFPSYEDFAIQN
ncbi:acylphosphatase [Streptococcus danieliae]|uniref:acylphosphatase n=1 Tax=Streptococcus danieliae TaxID=747656 RepID=A0A7Z0M6E9_9STRE|nr:acylphosphatase [Streptococcus danieliae]MBF0699584.1 acylphosphatase [Streptococcus danieliae]NYS96760.1 acylphosphatase [Streptococcus danieliae]